MQSVPVHILHENDKLYDISIPHMAMDLFTFCIFLFISLFIVKTFTGLDY